MHTLVFLIHVAVELISSSGYQIISQKKETKQASEKYGCQGAEICYLFQSSNAVDGDINTCTRTKEIGSSYTVKWTWWYVDLEKVLNIYSIRIQFKDYGEQYVMRQRGRFVGFSLYISNTTIKENGYLCYKNGQELPTLDFSTTCVKHGRYVIFYNERLDGTAYSTGYETNIVYTELCEVNVTGCKESGVCGYNCDLPCPNNCQELRCDIVNGTCWGCTAGWVGEFCNTSCPAGHYGLQCGFSCTGHCRDNLSCNHTTGQCDYGCGKGWTGIHCNTQCPAESYGPDCVYNCSGQCLSYLPCNRTTGRCDGGCNPGCTGELCEKECPQETYGPNCLYICGERCLSDLPCNSTTGIHDGCCNSGYTGEPIDKEAPNAEHGTPDAYISAFSISLVINVVLVVVIVILLR
ncbi:multiple epidermal growth factor-like domains protein 11 [Ostrea edulis]|uniref:multiple epidermal growth factor-like domains protein 11 n=1 Tax=Ostrea edulis TaxID=37623 RepID=UPI0024AF4853|nr:multiple epidermal growth factor-like domains protein 11 [Ostrea edulis]